MEEMIITGYQWIERQIQRDFSDLTTGNYLLVISLYDAYYDEEKQITVNFAINKEQGICTWDYAWWNGEECSLVGLISTRSLTADVVTDLADLSL